MLAWLGSLCAEGFRRWLPDPFVFAILLTIATAASAMLWVRATPVEVIVAWYEGFWMLLRPLSLTVAVNTTSPALFRLLKSLSGTVYLSVLLAGGLLTLVSWGWVVLTAVLGRELASRVRGLDYPFLVACVYLSSQTWVAGLSSSIPLLLNTPGNFLVEADLLASTGSRSSRRPPRCAFPGGLPPTVSTPAPRCR